jgi:hypothetical protein
MSFYMGWQVRQDNGGLASHRRIDQMLRASSKLAWIAWATTLLAATLVCSSWSSAQQSKRPKPRAKAPAAPTAPAAVSVPFRPGEILQYRILFSKYAVNAGNIQASVIEQRNFFGRLAWHFRVAAHTMDTMRVLFAIDDQFDSYTSAANLFSMQYELYLHEQGKEQTSLYRMTTDADPAPRDVIALRVAPGTRDAVSFLYNLRAADWQRTPELRAPVFVDGRRLYDAVARIDTPQGTAMVPAGNFPAFRIAIRLFDHGKELTDTRFWLWIAKDAAHTPVLVEADIPFGTARIELLHLP